jgi:hypothetical protein
VITVEEPSRSFDTNKTEDTWKRTSSFETKSLIFLNEDRQEEENTLDWHETAQFQATAGHNREEPELTKRFNRLIELSEQSNEHAGSTNLFLLRSSRISHRLKT